ncbi:MAG TPA: DUF951 domain-containing protein [Anaerolineae bacterium]|nr:DUF951 domain-containing protein [Anaerolineae bacterium]
MPAPLQLHLGDIARLRKPHPCGSYEWEIVRVGADIGIRCRQCGRRVLLSRRDFRRRLKRMVPPSAAADMAGRPSDHPAEG